MSLNSEQNPKGKEAIMARYSCPNCKFGFIGNPTGRCPQCGQDLSQSVLLDSGPDQGGTVLGMPAIRDPGGKRQEEGGRRVVLSAPPVLREKARRFLRRKDDLKKRRRSSGVWFWVVYLIVAVAVVVVLVLALKR